MDWVKYLKICLSPSTYYSSFLLSIFNSYPSTSPVMRSLKNFCSDLSKQQTHLVQVREPEKNWVDITIACNSFSRSHVSIWLPPNFNCNYFVCWNTYRCHYVSKYMFWRSRNSVIRFLKYIIEAIFHYKGFVIY